MKKLIALLVLAAAALAGCTRADYTGVILAMGIDGENYTFAVSAAEGADIISAEGSTAEEALEKAALASPRRPVYGNSVLILVGEGGAAALPEEELGATVAGVRGSAAETLEEDVLRLKRLFPAAAKENGIAETSLKYVQSSFAAGRGAEVPILADGAVKGMALLTRDGLIISEDKP